MPSRSVTDGRIALLCFPPYDAAFAAIAERRLHELETPSPEALQEALRGVYPDATVRPRDQLASFRPDETWYAYRDGRYSPYAGEEAWWDAPDVAQVIIDDSGGYLDASESALALLGISRDELQGLHTGDLADPAVAEIVPWVWDLVRETGELHSTSILAPRGERPRAAVEYRLVAAGAGPGRHVSYIREIPITAAEPSAAQEANEPGPTER
jgi:PAS domain-containing protein